MTAPWNMYMRGSRADTLAANRMARLGRGSDTTVGHLTPGEVVIPAGTITPALYAALQEAGVDLNRFMVGSNGNSINPATGQPEFLNPSQRDAYREYGESRNAAEGRSTGGTGRESGDSGSAVTSNQPGVTGNIPAASSSTTGGLNPSQVDAYRQYGATRAAAAARPDLGPDDWVQQNGQWGSMESTDYGPILDMVLPGPVNALIGLSGADTTFDRFEPAVPDPSSYNARRTSMGRESERQQGLSGQRAQQQVSFMRPTVAPTPQFLGLSSAMTPLQQRSAVASRAVAGQRGEYFSPEARSYYDNLLQRFLINDDGTLQDLDALLPIDLQYLAQIRGIENPTDTASLLSALNT